MLLQKREEKRTMCRLTDTAVGFLIIVLFALGLNIGAIFSKETVSEQENRTLETKPVFTLQAYFSGEYTSQWERYMNDHVPGREAFIQMSDWLEDIVAWKTENSVRIEQTIADIGVQEPSDAVEMQGILVLSNRVRELYQYDAIAEQQYIQAVNAYASWLPEEIQCYHMLIPMPIAFEKTEYQNLSDNQQNAIENVYRQLDNRIQPIDVYTSLSEHSNETLYFRTDHHWTALGARYGAEAFASVAQTALPSLQQYTAYTLEDYTGPLGISHSTEQMKEYPDEVIYYLHQNKNPMAQMYYYENGVQKYFEAPMINTSFAGGRGDYGIFLSGDYPVTVLQGNVDNGRVLAIIKDSYGNALAPWLTEGFERVICIDPRSCKENLTVLFEKYAVTDVLLLNYVKATSLPAYSQMLADLITNEGNSK